MERSIDESMSQQAGKANGTHMLLRSMLYPRIAIIQPYLGYGADDIYPILLVIALIIYFIPSSLMSRL
jgi:hypothetical protein